MGQPERIDEIISDLFSRDVSATMVDDDKWEFIVPFGDQYGDPFWITVDCQGQGVTLSDGGVVAGELFSLGLDDVRSTAFKILSSLAGRHDLVIDVDHGLVKASCPLNRLGDTLPGFVRVLLAILTVAPHLETKTNVRRVLGPRLRRRVRDSCEELGVLGLIRRDGYLRGVRNHYWPIDFQWPIHSDPQVQNVSILTADLNIRNPIQKASKVSMIAIDTKSGRTDHNLRVVIDSDTLIEEEALFAADLIEEHAGALEYSVIDYGDEAGREEFLTQMRDELLNNSGANLIPVLGYETGSRFK